MSRCERKPRDGEAARSRRLWWSGAAHSARTCSSVTRRVASAGALLAILLAIIPSGAAHAEDGGLAVLGELAYPTRDVPTPVVVDDASRRMYAVSGFERKIVEYDLTPRVPTVRRVGTISPLTLSPGAWRWALDPIRHRIYYLDDGGQCPACQYIHVLDLKTLNEIASYNLTQLIPHFIPEGLTYSSADRLLYMLGSVPGDPIHGQVAGGSFVPYLPAAVAAFDPDAGSAVWWKVIPQCLHVFTNVNSGATIARSRYQNALYIGCVRLDPNGTVSTPGESGLVRLLFTPRANVAQAALFPIDFFPISGTYSNSQDVTGIGDFDPVAERFYMLSVSELTPGAWVFDGRDSAWVGFLAGVTFGSHSGAPQALGVNPRSGHVLMDTGLDSNHRGLIISDGRATPVPQGRVFPSFVSTQAGNLLIDPTTSRVFETATLTSNGTNRLFALEDDTPRAAPTPSVSYDTLTTDVPEGPNTETTFSGSLNGYGSRVMLVGGTGGVVTSEAPALDEEPPIGASTLSVQGPDVWDRGSVLGLGPGDRGLFFGHVASIDVRGSGAAASAQAITPDPTTTADFTNEQNGVNQTLGQPDGQTQAWPWPAATCLDGGGKPANPDTSGTGTEAKANCDLQGQKGSAISSIGDITLSDGISIGGSSFDGSAVRTAADGIVTTATAVARDIRISVPGAGALTIGRIEAVARTSAHGRHHTAAVEWTRDIQHVTIVDASGKPIFSCATQCDTSAVEDAVHTWAGMKIAIRFPTPLTMATPGGAFGGVQKATAQYYDGFVVNDDDTLSSPAAEITAYNDYGQRSRVLIQLAAIEASSTYAISVLPPNSIFQPPPSIVVPPVGDILGPKVSQILPPPPPPPATHQGSLLERVIRSSRLLVRSPGDALLIALVATLAIAAGAACLRRRSLLGLLDDFSAGTSTRS